MKPVPREARTRNLSPARHRREQCWYCDDTGWVVVQTRPAQRFALNGRIHEPAEGACYEEMAPCPFCERGYGLEFPAADANVKPPWGIDGFWQGRDIPEIEPMRRGAPMPPAEQAKRMRELRQLMGGAAKDLEQ